MKRVVTNNPKEEIDASQASIHKFYGAKYEGGKYQVRQVEYGLLTFKSYALAGYTGANAMGSTGTTPVDQISAQHQPLTSHLENLIHRGFEVFEFDTLTEFAQWFEKE